MKALIIIAEGMDPIVAEREMDKGNLPWFSGQRSKNHYRRLNCGPVPYEPSNLNTAFSGVNPGKHGCFSYWATHCENERPRVLDANDVKAARIWEWPELSDCRFNVVNVQLTHPPRPINGNMISYLMHNTLNASYPRNLLFELSKQGIRYAHDVSLFYQGEPFEEFASNAWRIADYQLQTAMELAKDTDVLIVNLTLADRLSHFLWYEMSQVENAQGSAQERRPHVLAAYDFIDSACQQLQSLGAENTLVFSEMGFGELTHFVSINHYLQQAGLQVLDAEGNIDLKKSVAMETVQGSHGVMLLQDMLNEGRAPQSQLNEVIQCLEEARFEDGTPVLKNVRHRSEVYQGDYVHLAPSLIILPQDEKRPPLGDPRWATHVRRTSQSAWHRDKGFLVFDGLTPMTPSEEMAELQQIAPTVAKVLGKEPAAQCEMDALI
ncbi:alkaline phosphatase family protein [Hahella ganghwensis]|uniref:alkaline phosphatase family protein n=1 Tax=Hahella ganghwensis TaxID=286420 RepID=UPI00036FCD20|nr:alkaline phosphatase family protein [Hahella ganghwensis]